MFSKPYTRLAAAALTALLIVCSVFFLAASGSTQNGVQRQDFVTLSIPPRRAAVRGTAHPLARPQFDQGRVSPDQQLTGMALTFRLSASQQADLQELLREQQDRSSPNYHSWLTSRAVCRAVWHELERPGKGQLRGCNRRG